jgi:hypothetical protein
MSVSAQEMAKDIVVAALSHTPLTTSHLTDEKKAAELGKSLGQMLNELVKAINASLTKA